MVGIVVLMNATIIGWLVPQPRGLGGGYSRGGRAVADVVAPPRPRGRARAAVHIGIFTIQEPRHDEGEDKTESEQTNDDNGCYPARTDSCRERLRGHIETLSFNFTSFQITVA